MSVGCGYMNDPPELPGLAHFCEHMLFLGTEKYPNEETFKAMITKNGGTENASTSSEETKYYFDIKCSEFESALDIWSQFFLNPLFTESATEREMNAVDSEFNRNLNTDSRRKYQFIRSILGDPRHPYGKFSTGNLKTLKEIPEKEKIDVRNALKQFHSRYYSSNAMKLCLVGNHSLEEMEGWVEKYFSEIENKHVPVPSWKMPSSPSSPHFGEKNFGKRFFILPVKEMRKLDLFFPFEPVQFYYETNPESYISFLVGHESEGSILYALKEKGLAEELSAGVTSEHSDGSIFNITIRLTEEGLRRHEEVIDLVFAYLKMIKSCEPFDTILDEIKSLDEINFKMEQKVSERKAAISICDSLHLYPPPHVFDNWTLKKKDKAHIQKLLRNLDVNTFSYSIFAKECGKERKLKKKEEYYGFVYDEESIPRELLERWANVSPKHSLSFPKPNEFIPKSLQIVGTKSTKPVPPKLLKQTDKYSLWHKTDDTFLLPKVIIRLALNTPTRNASPRNVVLTTMVCNLVCEELNSFSYPAALAGLDFILANDSTGLVLKVSGFSDNAERLLLALINKMKTLKVEEIKFNIQKEKMRLAYANHSKENPSVHARDGILLLTCRHKFTAEEKLVEVEKMRVEDVQNFLPQLLSPIFVEAFFHGNVREEDSLGIINKVEELLQFEPLQPSSFPLFRVVKLEEGKEYARRISVKDPSNKNSAVNNRYEIGQIGQSYQPEDFKHLVTVKLFELISESPLFDILR